MNVRLPNHGRPAARLGVLLMGDLAESWDRVRQVIIEEIEVLIDELEAG